MAWIESHQELGQHPKTKRLARALQISLPAAIGHLHLLWWWALDYAQDGDLHKYTDEDIADAICWDGDAAQIANALITSGFIDQAEGGTRSIHDWYEYAGRLIDQRKAQDDYKKRQYALYNDLRLTRAVKTRDGDYCQYCGKAVNWNDRRGADGGTYDHIDPEGGNDLDNIVVSCRSCASKKGNRTPEEARMPFIFGGYTLDNGDNTVDIRQYQAENTQVLSTITQPDLTKPDHNLTQPDLTVDTPPTPPQAEGEGVGLRQKRFDEFWRAYPNKVGKGAAVKAWGRIKPNAELHGKILEALERAKQCDQWQRDNGRYIPHPTTWLNQGRWDDEPMPQGREPPQGGKFDTLGALREIIHDAEGGDPIDTS